MKILFYSAHPTLNLGSPAGYATHMRETIAAFRELGHHVDTFIVGGEKESDAINNISWSKAILKKVIPPLIWETIKDLKLIRNDKKNELKLNKLIREYHPDLIYERGYYLLLSGVSCAQRLNCKHILEMNAPYPEEKIQMNGKSLFFNYSKKVERFQVKSTNRLIVVSDALKKYYSKNNLDTEQKTLVVHNAISPRFIRSIQEFEKEKLKKELGFENKKVIGFVGSIFPYHGVDLLVKSFISKYDNCAYVGLLIVGNGVGLEDLRASSVESKNIVFTGNLDSKLVPNYINIMDICVMAKSNWYGSPVKIFEYGAYKKAVIGPRVKPVMEIINSGENGILIEGEKELSEAIDMLLNNEEERIRLGNQLFNKIQMNHTWVQNAKVTLEGMI